ncbi:MAG: hypothetical protein BECKG1743E_GA0114224_100203 [Candidatus Kentron sp. G]|nr:MAG: hypothetical protein BECKG1743E_GA0114224_100203 [Candidatus Kentron sp. G]
MLDSPLCPKVAAPPRYITIRPFLVFLVRFSCSHCHKVLVRYRYRSYPAFSIASSDIDSDPERTTTPVAARRAMLYAFRRSTRNPIRALPLSVSCLHEPRKFTTRHYRNKTPIPLARSAIGATKSIEMSCSPTMTRIGERSNPEMGGIHLRAGASNGSVRL